MSQNELQRVVAEMLLHIKAGHVATPSKLHDWASRIESAQAVAPGGGEMKFAFMAEVCDAAVQAMQANGLIKRTIRLQEVRDQLRQLAAAPASEAVGDDDVTDDPTTDQVAFARGYACGVRDTGAQDRAALLDLADRLERVPAFAARHTNDIAMLRRAAGEPAGKSVADQIMRDAMFGPYGMGVMRIDPSAMFKPAASSAAGGFVNATDDQIHAYEQEQAGELPEVDVSLLIVACTAYNDADRSSPTADPNRMRSAIAALLRRAARVEESQDAIEKMLDRMNGWAKAYPLDVFREVSDEEREWLHATRPGLMDRIAASMGRHMAKCMADDMATLTAGLEAGK